MFARSVKILDGGYELCPSRPERFRDSGMNHFLFLAKNIALPKIAQKSKKMRENVLLHPFRYPKMEKQ
jgi:hypothetical protein